MKTRIIKMKFEVKDEYEHQVLEQVAHLYNVFQILREHPKVHNSSYTCEPLIQEALQ